MDRKLQVIQELREAYKNALSDVTAANERGDWKTAYYSTRKMEYAYNAFQRAVEDYEKDRLRDNRAVLPGGVGDRLTRR